MNCGRGVRMPEMKVSFEGLLELWSLDHGQVGGSQ